MSTKRAPAQSRVTFRVATHDGERITVKEGLTRAEALAIDRNAYDCWLAKCLGRFGFKRPATGEWVPFGQNGHTIGPVHLCTLEAIQWHPGVYVDRGMLADLTGDEDLMDPAKFNQQVHRLRLGFGENKDTAHFIVTENGGVAWSANLTWISVEPVLTRGDGTSEGEEAAS